MRLMITLGATTRRNAKLRFPIRALLFSHSNHMLKPMKRNVDSIQRRVLWYVPSPISSRSSHLIAFMQVGDRRIYAVWGPRAGAVPLEVRTSANYMRNLIWENRDLRKYAIMSFTMKMFNLSMTDM
jgi:hypothetical protein